MLLSFLRELEFQENIILFKDINLELLKDDNEDSSKDNREDLSANLKLVVYGKI